ncbi:MAG: M18 family aminopeptidase [Myxococcaceae bacterium]|nr:M18 family aminopeptidase [Myxococcaceae bacterium]
MPNDLADDLLRYIDAAPTPWHAVAETTRRLEAAGFCRLDEREKWTLKAGDRVYVVRAGTSVAAFQLGTEPVDRTGFRLVGAHTDSPNLRLKPNAAYAKAGFQQLAVEVYGGVLWYTWLDRDLSLAGRVVVATPDGGTRTHLVDFGRTAIARVPSLAIHLNRSVNTEGLKLNPQEHLAPVWALDGEGNRAGVRAEVAKQLARTGVKVEVEDVLAYDLCLYDVQPGARSGLVGEFIQSARLDNLASCHAGLTALLEKRDRRSTVGIVLYDHEEVGSRSAQGAASPFLRDCLERITLAHSDGAGDAFHRAIQASFLISADMAHGIHPNYAEKHEPRHQPVLGAGPVIKSNVNQSYATDAESMAFFVSLCRACDVQPQHFVVRTDLPCGSTIGPITAGELGIRTIDVGNPMLGMHSIREMAAAADVEKMIAVLRRFFA